MLTMKTKIKVKMDAEEAAAIKHLFDVLRPTPSSIDLVLPPFTKEELRVYYDFYESLKEELDDD